MKRLLVWVIAGVAASAGCCWRPAWCNQPQYAPQTYGPAPVYYQPAPTQGTAQPVAPCTCQ
ncbi:MAG TPA: hypothetical protein VHV77_08610 [Pirellulales bacterium]|nr:hypothetical protein [Pirellulales bacterium]